MAQLEVKLPTNYTQEGNALVCQRTSVSGKKRRLYKPDANTLITKPKQIPALPVSYTLKHERPDLQKLIDNKPCIQQNSSKENPASVHKQLSILTENADEQTEQTSFLQKTKKVVEQNPKSSVRIGTAIVALGETLVYKTNQLFTRKSQRSHPKHQINHKYNDPAKNKI